MWRATSDNRISKSSSRSARIVRLLSVGGEPARDDDSGGSPFADDHCGDDHRQTVCQTILSMLIFDKLIKCMPGLSSTHRGAVTRCALGFSGGGIKNEKLATPKVRSDWC